MGLPKDRRHFTGSAGAAHGGVRDGYTPESDSLAQAKYASQLDRDATGKQGRLTRIRRALRRLLWEF